ncbi:MAG TPA: hypothetical protein P5270_06920 [Victivallales bacterium]|nr:hypothetical protein [Victivallales bacterium]HPO91397.1 hypothetical protein [Victivallales bacterium]HRR29079.1 hypothetical protein [Victivallales bacterium]HRU01715.1 hypothetical protein [Victivallales bacterium]
MKKEIILFIFVSIFAFSSFSNEIQNENITTFLILPASLTSPEDNISLDYGWKNEKIEFLNEILHFLYSDPQIGKGILNPLFDADKIKEFTGYLVEFNWDYWRKNVYYDIATQYFDRKRTGVDFVVEIVEPYDKKNQDWRISIYAYKSIIGIKKTEVKEKLISLLKSISNQTDDEYKRIMYSRLSSFTPESISERENILKYKGKNIDDIPPDEAFKIKPRDLSFGGVKVIYPTIEFVTDNDLLKPLVEKLSDSLSNSELHVLLPDRSNKSKRHFTCYLSESHQEKEANGTKWCIARIDLKIPIESGEIFSDYHVVIMPVQNKDFTKIKDLAIEKASNEIVTRFKPRFFVFIDSLRYDQMRRDFEKKTKKKQIVPSSNK